MTKYMLTQADQNNLGVAVMEVFVRKDSEGQLAAPGLRGLPQRGTPAACPEHAIRERCGLLFNLIPDPTTSNSALLASFQLPEH